MCVVYVSYGQYESMPLLLATNRDEFYQRESQPISYWEDHPEILGGRDLEGGGSWLAVGKDQKWAVITNYRGSLHKVRNPLSRGSLIQNYLSSSENAIEFGRKLLHNKEQYYHSYQGFNILFGDSASLYYFSNITGSLQRLSKGLYGLSNHLLDTPWPKVRQGKADFETILQNSKLPSHPPSSEELFAFLQDASRFPYQELPDTGIGKEKEQLLSSRFISLLEHGYGTRCSSLLYILTEKDPSLSSFKKVSKEAQSIRRCLFIEQSYTDQGNPQQQKSFQFQFQP